MANEWKLLISHLTGRYHDGFDRNREYEFKRAGSEELMRFRMADCDPYFNIAGLLYREITDV